MIVADTGAILALLDRHETDHALIRALYIEEPDAWILPWAILPEVDYLVTRELGAPAEQAWLDDLANGAFTVDSGARGDLAAAQALAKRYASLEFGLVDAIVMTMAERLRADIATFDLRHFAAVRLAHTPKLLPRDVQPPGRHRSRARGRRT
jgi:predicted nucleic acid-binding protein